jgi:predicted TIM-barrel fold metal-dependent hydrolase
MHARGVRGVRCNLINPGGLTPAAVARWQPVLQALGWHVEMHVAVDRFAAWTEIVQSFEIPVVIDHMGRPIPGAIDLRSPALATLVQFVSEGRCFVKLSAPYRLSGGPAPWVDVAPLARAFVAANPSACCWGTDWPHVDTESAVDTGEVVSALDDWVGDSEARRLITTDAAERLYA